MFYPNWNPIAIVLGDYYLPSDPFVTFEEVSLLQKSKIRPFSQGIMFHLIHEVEESMLNEISQIMLDIIVKKRSVDRNMADDSWIHACHLYHGRYSNDFISMIKDTIPWLQLTIFVRGLTSDSFCIQQQS